MKRLHKESEVTINIENVDEEIDWDSYSGEVYSCENTFRRLLRQYIFPVRRAKFEDYMGLVPLLGGTAFLLPLVNSPWLESLMSYTTLFVIFLMLLWPFFHYMNPYFQHKKLLLVNDEFIIITYESEEEIEKESKKIQLDEIKDIKPSGQKIEIESLGESVKIPKDSIGLIHERTMSI